MGNSFSYKDILNELGKHNDKIHPITPEESKDLKDCLYEMSVDIDERCRKNGLTLFMVGGTLLGAVRHGGFIPWDDDMDFAMYREDYRKLIDIFDLEFGDKYILCCPNSPRPNGNRFMQIYRKGTVLKSISSGNPLTPEAVGIDIFPFDDAPENALQRKVKGTRANLLMFIASCVMDEKYSDPAFKAMLAGSEKGKLFLRIRSLTGKVFSFRKPENWFNAVDRSVRYPKKTSLITIAVGRGHYFGELSRRDAFYPPQEKAFREHLFHAPKDTEGYLLKMYGNTYMELPKEEDRESHYILEYRREEQAE